MKARKPLRLREGVSRVTAAWRNVKSRFPEVTKRDQRWPEVTGQLIRFTEGSKNKSKRMKYSYKCPSNQPRSVWLNLGLIVLLPFIVTVNGFAVPLASPDQPVNL